MTRRVRGDSSSNTMTMFLPGVGEGTVALEFASPARVTRIGVEPTVPPPPPVLALVNSLVHAVVGGHPDE